MLKSYVGIASPSGLEAFLPERRRTVRALVERVRRRQAVCYWAVLPDTAAAEVERHLERGDRKSALFLLDRAATQAGPILPSDPTCGRSRSL
jgi:hypothetical protein